MALCKFQNALEAQKGHGPSASPTHRALHRWTCPPPPFLADGRLVAKIYTRHGRFLLDLVAVLPFIYLVGRFAGCAHV